MADQPSREQYQHMAQIIYQSTGTMEQLIRDLAQYILRNNPKITAEQAKVLASLFPINRPYEYANVIVGSVPYSTHLAYPTALKHLIYSRIVDKWNLRPRYGVEGYYYRPPEDPPSYYLQGGLESTLINRLLRNEQPIIS
jgi:hypothetical protein